MDEEATLLERAKAGSVEAFGRLVELHQAQIRGYVARYVRNPDAADDVAQETFLEAYGSLSTFRGEGPIRIWLLGIARHLALTYVRQEQARRKQQASLVESALAGWLAREMESQGAEVSEPGRELSALKQCLEKLTETSADIVTHFYYKGHSATDIARRLRTTEGTIWVTLTRIRQALRRCVELRLKTSGAV